MNKFKKFASLFTVASATCLGAWATPIEAGFMFWRLDGSGENQEWTHFPSNADGGWGTMVNGCYSINNYFDPDSGKWTGFGYSNSTQTDYNSPVDIMACCNSDLDGLKYGVAHLDDSHGPITIKTTEPGYRYTGPRQTIFTNTACVKQCILEGDGINGPFERGDKCGVRVYGYVTAYDYDAPNSDKVICGKWLDEPIELVLADFTDEDAAKWFIVHDWQSASLDFQDIEFKVPDNEKYDKIEYGVTEYRFEFFSTKTKDGKVTTPPYFCLGGFEFNFTDDSSYFETKLPKAYASIMGLPLEIKKTVAQDTELSFNELTGLKPADGKITYIVSDESESDSDFSDDGMVVDYLYGETSFVKEVSFRLEATQNYQHYYFNCQFSPATYDKDAVTYYAKDEEEIDYASLTGLNPSDGPVRYSIKELSTPGCNFSDDKMTVSFRFNDEIIFDLSAYQNGNVYNYRCTLINEDTNSVLQVGDETITGYTIYTPDGCMKYQGIEFPALDSGIYIVVRHTANGPVSSLEIL